MSIIAEDKRMFDRELKYVGRILVVAFAALIPVALSAQVTATSSGKSTAADGPSKWDIFAGYSALIPNQWINGYGFQSIDYGAIGSVTRFFNKNFGVTFEGDEHVLLPQSQYPPRLEDPNDDFSGGYGGVIYRIPMGNITPFVHVLAGAELAGSYYVTDTWGPAITAGGGLDVGTPAFKHHLSIRLFQADYQYLHENFPASPNYKGGSVTFNPQGRISAGLVYGIGAHSGGPPVTLACSVNPQSVYPGELVTVTATAGDLNPKLHVVYSWSGLNATGNNLATVSTVSLAPGTYTITGQVKEGKPGQEGEKPNEVASCTTSFVVKAFQPPTISCSAAPARFSRVKPAPSPRWPGGPRIAH